MKSNKLQETLRATRIRQVYSRTQDCSIAEELLEVDLGVCYFFK